MSNQKHQKMNGSQSMFRPLADNPRFRAGSLTMKSVIPLQIYCACGKNGIDEQGCTLRTNDRTDLHSET